MIAELALKIKKLNLFADCQLYLRSNATHDKAPLWLKPKGALYVLQEPKGSYFQWNERESVLIGCASSKNMIVESTLLVPFFSSYCIVFFCSKSTFGQCVLRETTGVFV